MIFIYNLQFTFIYLGLIFIIYDLEVLKIVYYIIFIMFSNFWLSHLDIWSTWLFFIYGMRKTFDLVFVGKDGQLPRMIYWKKSFPYWPAVLPQSYFSSPFINASVWEVWSVLLVYFSLPAPTTHGFNYFSLVIPYVNDVYLSPHLFFSSKVS